jgi:ribosomal subunit interface protein
MTFRVSGQNIDIGEALRMRVTERVSEALTKYFDGGASGHVTVSRDGFGYRTECVLHLTSGMTLHAEGNAVEAYGSADDAATHLEKRLRRYKRRLKDHHHGRGEAPPVAPSYVIAAPDEEEEAAPNGEYHPVIIAEGTTGLRQLSVGEAVLDLDLSGAPVLVFRHAGHGRVNVVYRRADGNIGWIDTPPAAVSQ